MIKLALKLGDFSVKYIGLKIPRGPKINPTSGIGFIPMDCEAALELIGPILVSFNRFLERLVEDCEVSKVEVQSMEVIS